MSDEDDDLDDAKGTTDLDAGWTPPDVESDEDAAIDAEESGTGSDASSAGAGSDFEVETVVAYLQWGTLAALLVLAFVAAVSIYTSLSTAIDLWVSQPYRPFVDAGFNLAVLCVSLAGVAALLRRL